MFKIVRKSDDLQKTLVISFILHAIMFVTLIRNPFNGYIETLSRNRTQSVINSMMVEFNSSPKNFDHKRQKISKEQTENHSERCIKKELLEKKLIEQKHQEYLNKEQLQARETERVKMKKKEKIEKNILKVEEKTKSLENLQRKDKINVSNLFGYLDLNGNTPKDINREKEKVFLSLGEKGNHVRMSSDSANINDINIYARRIKEAIERSFYDFSSYTGKICRLKLRIAPDGMLLDVKPECGDHVLCTMALAAARQAKFPQPPSQEVYNIFKNTSLDFKP